MTPVTLTIDHLIAEQERRHAPLIAMGERAKQLNLESLREREAGNGLPVNNGN